MKPPRPPDFSDAEYVELCRMAVKNPKTVPNPEYIRVARGKFLGGNKYVEIFEKDNSMTDLFNQEAERMKNAPKVWVEPVVVFPENMGGNVRAVESE